MEADELPSRMPISPTFPSGSPDRTPPSVHDFKLPQFEQPATTVDEPRDHLNDPASAVIESDVVGQRSPPSETTQLRLGGAGSGGGRRSSRDGLGTLYGRDVASGKGSLRRRAGLAPARPLLPVSERKSQEEQLQFNRLRRDTETERPDLTPDGGSAGREGRQFAVANVGNNGRIYLRPTVRPVHQRLPQPDFVFPITPPSTSGLDALAKDSRHDGVSHELHGSEWGTPSAISADVPAPDSQPLRDHQHTFNPPTDNLLRRKSSHPRRRRAHSDSTIRDAASVVKESDDGAFKVVISKPLDDARPKTMEDADTAAPPVLDIAIPSWRLGTPRFSIRGTPLLRGSSYAPTEEMLSSKRASSLLLRSRDFPPPLRASLENRATPRPPSVPRIRLSAADSTRRTFLSTIPRLPQPARSTYISTYLVIEPAMFDSLTLKPMCDDRAIVRYSPTTGAVTAATPPRLVAEITSPSFLDYELISDFFLTYRSFLDSSHLLRMLIVRFRWAVARLDEIGKVVRVRTFVALRHWILNYFLDDFVVDYDLRVSFCTLVNDLVQDLQDTEGDQMVVPLKILAELKKCWRRVCAQYWDGSEFDANLGPGIPITPGGVPGFRNPDLDPEFWDTEAESAISDGPGSPPQLQLRLLGESTTYLGATSEDATPTTAGGRPGTPETPLESSPDDLTSRQMSPTSIASIDVVSCSFPGKGMRNFSPGAAVPPAAHPAPPGAVQMPAGPVAVTPKALVGKRVRPTHKRTGSLSDSLREHTAERGGSVKEPETLYPLSYAGGLVRGNLLPPAQAYVEVVAPELVDEAQRQTTMLQAARDEGEKARHAPSAMSGQGMKKLIGSVRRAISTRGQGPSPTNEHFISISPLGPKGATLNRLPGTAIVPQAQPAPAKGGRPTVRMDLLGAEIAEDFKRAVREDAAAEAAAGGLGGQKSSPHTPTNNSVRDSTPTPRGERSYPPDIANRETFNAPRLYQDDGHGAHYRPSIDMAMTAGSKSIIIVDETMQFDFNAATGGFMVANSSVEAFADTLMPNGGDPTPPTTPPGHMVGTPRRSSQLLTHNHGFARPSSLVDPLPPFVPDLDTLSHGYSSRHSFDTTTNPSMYGASTTNRSVAFGPGPRSIHQRQLSRRTNESRGSALYRRRPSFRSGYSMHQGVRSFDATTQSESVAPRESTADINPHRVLRRRPGGDLRAAQTVGELDDFPLRRSHSVESMTAYSDSVQSSSLASWNMDSAGVAGTSLGGLPGPGETFSLGALADPTTLPPPQQDASFFVSISSSPVMRPSFEAEAHKLAQIPDDVDDDGGVESALLKLEGKYEKKSLKLSAESQPSPVISAEKIGVAVGDPEFARVERREHRNQHVEAGVLSAAPPPNGFPQPSSDAHGSFLSLPHHGTHDTTSFLTETSQESYNSVPLLDRDLTDDGRSKTAAKGWTNVSVLQDSDEEMIVDAANAGVVGVLGDTDSQPLQHDYVESRESLEVTRPAAAAPPDDEQSFLDDNSDDGNCSDLSSELSIDPLDSDGCMASGFGAVSNYHDADDGNPHSITDRANNKTPPPSPPITLVQALQLSPETASVPQLHEHQVWLQKPLPPTPGTSPTTTYSAQPESPGYLAAGTAEALSEPPKMLETGVDPTYPAHLPFILAFDSDILAQQFTLIEKDALNEVDWKELIDMGWKNASNQPCRSWVDFLRNSDAHGVEVVIARFNILVKWAVSEIVLTQDIEERARCIIKFIHIAQHCRRHRNFATMAQITVALSNQEIARLSKTWSLIPEADMNTLRELEQLVSPTRNFYSLRAEMESGSDSGCIPFVGIYTHDLLFNLQRPSEIASSPTTAPLVNFERCRCSAAVVKTLLRLLESSTKYQFQPIEGITERCLWMSALPDEDIRRLSESLQ